MLQTMHVEVVSEVFLAIETPAKFLASSQPVEESTIISFANKHILLELVSRYRI
jgi:hypothetical protein